jgi:hypothetical protein
MNIHQLAYDRKALPESCGGESSLERERGLHT